MTKTASDKAQAIAPTVVITTLIAWWVFGDVVGYVWLAIIVMWLTIGTVMWGGRYGYVLREQYRQTQRNRGIVR
jgi:hypothetical protein